MDEGYIKFNCEWERTKPLKHEAVQDLIDWRQKAYFNGWIGAYANGIGFGNLSRRVENDNFLISGSATGTIRKLTESHFTLVDQFNVEENYVHCSGPIIASSESMSHGVIYRHFPQVNAVIHIHNRMAWESLKDVVSTTALNIPYGTPQMAAAIVELLTKKSDQSTGLFVMAGHEEGIIAYGSSLEEAWKQLELFISV